MSSPFKIAPDEQLWFFLKEDMNLPTFVQQQYTLADVRRNGINLESVLTILNVKDEVQKFAFYLHSASMAAAVRLLSDESILVTYNLYCQKDDVVTILVRSINEHSPNTSRSPSHQNSLRERRKISRGALVPEIFIQPAPRHASGTIDVSTMEEIEDENNMVTLDLGDGDFVTFTKEYLICWITSQLEDGKSLIDIVVQSFGPNRTMRKFQLTADIWQRSLIRGPWEKDFSPLWNDYNRIRVSRETILASLSQEFPNFTQSCQNFIHDLREFSDNKAARNRLDKTGHAYYLGRPYFEENIREKILTIPTKNGTLQDDFNLLAAKRSEGEICAAHDLSPLYETVLGVEWDKIRGKGVAMHQQIGGLSLQQQASQPGTARQLAKKSSQFLKSTFGKRGGGRRDGTSGAGGSKSAGW